MRLFEETNLLLPTSSPQKYNEGVQKDTADGESPFVQQKGKIRDFPQQTRKI